MAGAAAAAMAAGWCTTADADAAATQPPTGAAAAPLRRADAPSPQLLPTDKLACHMSCAPPRIPVVLVSCGSFNPPTHMHVRLFELAAAELARRGLDVIGGYMSPVGAAYGKPWLEDAQHRVAMCRLAAHGSGLAMVDGWEASREEYTPTLQVLRRVAAELQRQLAPQPPAAVSAAPPAVAASPAAPDSAAPAAPGPAPCAATTAAPCPAPSASVGPGGSSAQPHVPGPAAGAGAMLGGAAAPGSGPTAPDGAQQVRVMLLCGADLLATMAQPGVWREPEAILTEHGVVAVSRSGAPALDALLSAEGGLLAAHAANVIVVRDSGAGGEVSSTAARAELAAGRSAEHLVPRAVYDYICRHGLYSSSHGGGDGGAGDGGDGSGKHGDGGGGREVPVATRV